MFYFELNEKLIMDTNELIVQIYLILIFYLTRKILAIPVWPYRIKLISESKFGS